MYRKLVLVLLALSLVSSFASMGFVEVEVDFKEANKSLESKIDTGLLLGQNKEFVVFAGGKAVFLGGYLGARFDSKIYKNTRLALTGIVNSKKISDRAIIEQIKGISMKDWDGKKDKEYIFFKNGIKNEDSFVLLSAIGSYDRYIFDANYGIIYNIDNVSDVNHTIESFAGFKTKFDKINVEANISHVIGKYEGFKGEYNKTIFDAKEVKDDQNTFSKGGRLKGDIKLSAKVNNILLSTKLLVDHDKIKEAYIKTDDKIVNFKGGVENRVGYSKDGFKVDANLDYKARVFIDKKAFNSHKLKTTDKKVILHNPEVVLKLEKDFDKFKVRSNTNDIANTQQILSEVLKQEVSNKDLKHAKFDNLFFTDNILEYKAVDGLTLGLRLKALNYIYGYEHNDTKDQIKPFKKYRVDNKVGVGILAKYEKTFTNLSVKSELGAAYILNHIGKLEKTDNFNHDFRHDVVAFLLNEAKYKLNDNFSFEGSINLADKVSGIYKDSVDDKVKSNNDLYIQLRFKPIYTNNVGVTLSNETNFYSSLSNQVLQFGITVDPEVKYKANENVTFGSKIGFVYRNELESHTEVKHEFKNIKDLTFGHNYGLDKPKDVKYEDRLAGNKLSIVERNLVVADGEVKKAIDEETKEIGTNVSVFNAKPSVYVTMKFLDKKLSIEPKFELGLTSLRKMDNNPLKLAKVTGKGSLKVEYVW